MRDPQAIVVRPLMTEKNMDRVQKRSVYSFEVVEDANKVEIRHAIETLFNVKVLDVRTLVKKGARKRVGLREVQRANVKKAIVQLKEGEKIDIL